MLNPTRSSTMKPLHVRKTVQLPSSELLPRYATTGPSLLFLPTHHHLPPPPLSTVLNTGPRRMESSGTPECRACMTLGPIWPG